MKKLTLLLFVSVVLMQVAKAQHQAKAAYVEIGGPGLLSVNYDMRFAKKDNGFGFRAGAGAFSVGGVSAVTVPFGLNYLLGNNGRHYFEVGAGFTYLSLGTTKKSTTKNFNESFGNFTLGYRYAPAKGGFFFKAELTPVFGGSFFIPYYGGLGFGYQF